MTMTYDFKPDQPLKSCLNLCKYEKMSDFTIAPEQLAQEFKPFDSLEIIETGKNPQNLFRLVSPWAEDRDRREIKTDLNKYLAM